MRTLLAVLVVLAIAAGCQSPDDSRPAVWLGTVDTLSSGQVVVSNPEEPLWAPGEEWQVLEQARIGSALDSGPAVFGRVDALEVDPAGRIWVLDGQAQEVRIFEASGEYIRTIGGPGSGPGEFSRAVRIDMAPDGNVWVMDPMAPRVSVFDTAGVYQTGMRPDGGFLIVPWPGRFDENGAYYAPTILPERTPQFGVVRYGPEFQPLDTLDVPSDPIEREYLELRDGDGPARVAAGIPFSGGVVRKLSSIGSFWGLLTDEYRLVELESGGDTVRTITRAFTPVPVTALDRERASEDLTWFTDMGGRIDWSIVPDTKPAVVDFFFDDEGHVWVMPETAAGENGRLLHVFDPEGRFLGEVRLPFPLETYPTPMIRNRKLYGVTLDELDVPYVVRAEVLR